MKDLSKDGNSTDNLISMIQGAKHGVQSVIIALSYRMRLELLLRLSINQVDHCHMIESGIMTL